MSVQEAINVWGRAQLGKVKKAVPEGTVITLDEELPSSNYCETCGPDPFKVTISGGGESTQVYMTMGEIVSEILVAERPIQGDTE